MKNVLQRLLLFFVGVPLVAALIILLPGTNHLAIVIAAIGFCAGCSLELSGLFKARGIKSKAGLFALVGAGLPACAFSGGLVIGPSFLEGSLAGLSLGVVILLLFCFSRFAFVRAADIQAVIPQASALAFTAIYPGAFGSAVVLIAAEPRFATESMLTFCILAFSNDALAWLVGMSLGRIRGVVEVSPNKSVEGFVGGMVGSIGMAFACAALFPKAIPGTWWMILVLGLMTGVAVIIGDLFESALKRSAGTKDSGDAVPGRGGFLDSFDSLLFSAPVFYGLCLLLGFFR